MSPRSVSTNKRDSPITPVVIFIVPDFQYSLKKLFSNCSLNVNFLFRLKLIVELTIPPVAAEKI